MSEPYRVEPGTKVDLGRHDPADTAGFEGGKVEGQREAERLTLRIEALQEALWAEGRRRLLVVLQAMDTGGKDGTIRHVFDGVNPQGVRVASFKAPSASELARDYLWRVHLEVPRRGEIVIFNRSHYEDVLAVPVLGLAPEKVWKRRFEHINAFERLLADEGTTIVKLFLHISKDEQKRRLQSRLDEPGKRWKFNRSDLTHRARWNDFMRAYEAVLEKTSTAWAPWYVIPSDRKWYRNVAVSRILVATLEALDIRQPEPTEDLSAVVIE